MAVDSSALRAGIRTYGISVAEKAAKSMAADVRRAAPVHKPDARDPRPRQGGTLRDSIQTKASRIGITDVRMRIFTEVDYASFQDQGTNGPYIIRPRRPGGMLVFFWPRGPQGARVYAFPKVTHPGIQNPSRFWTKTVTQAAWLGHLTSIVRLVGRRI